MVYKDSNILWQVLGGFSGIIALFLPGILLVLFFYPVFNNFQRHVIVLQSINGIQASVVGMMLTSTIYLMYNTLISPMVDITSGILPTITIAITFFILRYTKLSPHFLVIAFILLGLIF
jgi:chromate transporter